MTLAINRIPLGGRGEPDSPLEPPTKGDFAFNGPIGSLLQGGPTMACGTTNFRLSIQGTPSPWASTEAWRNNHGLRDRIVGNFYEARLG